MSAAWVGAPEKERKSSETIVRVLCSIEVRGTDCEEITNALAPWRQTRQFSLTYSLTRDFSSVSVYVGCANVPKGELSGTDLACSDDRVPISSSVEVDWHNGSLRKKPHD